MSQPAPLFRPGQLCRTTRYIPGARLPKGSTVVVVSESSDEQGYRYRVRPAYQDGRVRDEGEPVEVDEADLAPARQVEFQLRLPL